MRDRGTSGPGVVYQPANRRRTILALIVLTAVTLITLDVRGSGPISALRGGAHDVVNPSAGAFGTAFSPVGDWIDRVTSAASLKDENAHRRRQLDAAPGPHPAAPAATHGSSDLKK